MRLFLTSDGLSNATLVQSLEELLGKSATDVPLAFIPTAASIDAGDKSWMIDNLSNIKAAGFSVDIVDISAVEKENWLPRLQSVEVLFFGGGNTMHLMRWMTTSGLQQELPALLATRVYAGISAGSCIAGPNIFNTVQNLFGEEYDLVIKDGLRLVDFHFVPHLNSPFFDKVRAENLEHAVKKIDEPVYALDDHTALIVQGGEIRVVGEGEHLYYAGAAS